MVYPIATNITVNWNVRTRLIKVLTNANTDIYDFIILAPRSTEKLRTDRIHEPSHWQEQIKSYCTQCACSGRQGHGMKAVYNSRQISVKVS